MCVSSVGAGPKWEVQLSDPRGVHVGEPVSGVLWQWGWPGRESKYTQTHPDLLSYWIQSKEHFRNLKMELFLSFHFPSLSRWVHYPKTGLLNQMEVVDPLLPSGQVTMVQVQVLSPVRRMRIWTSCTKILLPTAPPLEHLCHLHCQPNQSKEVGHSVKSFTATAQY